MNVLEIMQTCDDVLEKSLPDAVTERSKGNPDHIEFLTEAVRIQIQKAAAKILLDKNYPCGLKELADFINALRESASRARDRKQKDIGIPVYTVLMQIADVLERNPNNVISSTHRKNPAKVVSLWEWQRNKDQAVTNMSAPAGPGRVLQFPRRFRNLWETTFRGKS